jgi:transposase-like protein
VQATRTRPRFEVTCDGEGIAGHAGAALLGELADRLGLTGALGWRAGRTQTSRHRHDVGAVLRDLMGRCCICCEAQSRHTAAMRTRRPRPAPIPRSAFAGFCFPPDVIVLAVRWYLRFGLSYCDVEELLVERGIAVDHVTVYRWVRRFTPLLVDAARPCRHLVGDCWFVDETYVKVAGRWRYVYRAVDQFGQVIDAVVSPRRDAAAAQRFFQRAIGATHRTPSEVVTDLAATYPVVLEELLPAAWHRTDRYANNRIEADHGRLKARLRPMRGLAQDRSAKVVIAGHAFVQNLRRGHYELAVEEPVNQRVAVAFDALALVI